MQEYFFHVRVLTPRPYSDRVRQEFLLSLFTAYFFLSPLLSLTLLPYGFLQRRVEEWEKVRTPNWRTFSRFPGILAYKSGWLFGSKKAKDFFEEGVQALFGERRRRDRRWWERHDA